MKSSIVRGIFSELSISSKPYYFLLHRAHVKNRSILRQMQGAGQPIPWEIYMKDTRISTRFGVNVEWNNVGF